MSNRIVPEYTMDNISISNLPELRAHLDQLSNDPSTPFNAKLFDDVELQLTEDNIPALLPVLLPPLTDILKSTTQDPTPCLSLTIKLLSPLPFSRTLTIADPPSLVTALGSPLPGANLLALAIIHKAARSPSDAAILSTLPEVVEAVVRRWLEADDTGVAEKAGRVLGDLLETDCDVVGGVGESPAGLGQVNGVSNADQQLVRRRRTPGHGRLWRLILDDRPILSLIPALCSPSSSRTEHQVSYSQGRLLRLLPRLATLKLDAVTRSQFPDLFSLPDAHTGVVPRGLLPWAALAMVDSSDILMHLNLVDFFETFVSVMRVADTRTAAVDAEVKAIVRAAVYGDPELRDALTSLPNRTVEEEAEALRSYIQDLLD